MILADRVKEISTTEGTGAFTLGGAAPGFRTFNDVLADGDEVPYCIATQTPGSWEVGLGTYSSGELSRDTVLSSSNAGALVDFLEGVKDVFLTMPADRLPALALRYASGTLVTAEIEQLFTTPVEVFPDVAGVVILPRYLYVRKPNVTLYTLNGSASLQLNYGAASGALNACEVTAAGTFDQSAEKKALWEPDTRNFGGATPISGLGLRWAVPTANWALFIGAGDIHWELYYHKLVETV